jgi:DNA-binding protein HU-beta
MNKTELIDVMAERMNVSKVQAKDTVDNFLDALIDGLGKDQKVVLVGFGVFSVSERKARVGVNPKTGEKINIPASKSVKFRAAKNLKDMF